MQDFYARCRLNCGTTFHNLAFAVLLFTVLALAVLHFTGRGTNPCCFKGRSNGRGREEKECGFKG